MIGQLRGRLAGKRPNQVLVDVGGVGYLVQVPLSTYGALGELHTEVTLLIHTHVREDALALFGFVSSRAKHFFELLISASGVGPALALKNRPEAVAIETEKPAVASAAGVEADVVTALVNLGYDTRTAEEAAAEAKRAAGTGNFEKLLRATLHSLSAPKGRSTRAGA